MYNFCMTYVYRIRNSIGKLYSGMSENPEERLAHHNSRMGAKFTSTALGTGTNTLDFKIIFRESYPDLPSTRKREIQIKKWRRDKKELLIEKYQAGHETKI